MERFEPTNTADYKACDILLCCNCCQSKEEHRKQKERRKVFFFPSSRTKNSGHCCTLFTLLLCCDAVGVRLLPMKISPSRSHCDNWLILYISLLHLRSETLLNLLSRFTASKPMTLQFFLAKQTLYHLMSYKGKDKSPTLESNKCLSATPYKKVG